MIEAAVICDSISQEEVRARIITLKLRYPKFIHGEFMTHRHFSRNASSSRAIPVAKLIEEVRTDALRAGPVFWGMEQKGMQASQELSHAPRILAEREWRDAALRAADSAERMAGWGVHKNLVNRLLEPFSHINVVVTSTEWDNFFGLRLHQDAQPEMRALAIAMWQAIKDSWPETLNEGEWHLPFVDQSDFDLFQDSQEDYNFDQILEAMIKVSVARCARVSYESFETKKRSTVEEDLKLHDRLIGRQPQSLLPMPLHASPAEHQATPDPGAHFINISGHRTVVSNNRHLWGNFTAWKQYRKTLPGEAVAPLPREYANEKR